MCAEFGLRHLIEGSKNHVKDDVCGETAKIYIYRPMIIICVGWKFMLSTAYIYIYFMIQK